MKKIILLLILNCTSLLIFSQKNTLSGYIKDAENGEELIGASVYIDELKNGTVSNLYGFYSLTLPKGKYHLTVSFLGYETQKHEIQLNENIEQSFSLSPQSQNIAEIDVTGERIDKNVTGVEMSVIELPIATIKSIPALMGEVDIIKSLLLLPGIQSSGEGSSGFHVRGGGVDQNLILTDDATVYNSSHLFGFFSVFNYDAVKDVKIYKGGIPAKYGGRLSSLLDIKMKEGNSKEFTAKGGIGLISSRLTIESPIIKDKASFLLSGRRTYFDLFFPFFEGKPIADAKVYFYDLNAKINYTLNSKNRVFLSAYLGDDIMRFSKDFKTTYGNKTLSFRYNHLFSARIFSNFTLIYSNFNYGLGVPEGEMAFQWISNIIDYSLKNDYTWFINTNNSLNWGFGVTHHTFSPGVITALSEKSFVNNMEMPKNFALDNYVFIDNEIKLGNWNFKYGLRYSIFQNYGKSTFYEFNKSNSAEYKVTDTLQFDGGIIKTHAGFEPRINVRWQINSSTSIKANYNRTLQFLHLATNSQAPTPYDFWFPSSLNIEPQNADQVALGIFKNFRQNIYEASVEIYYKKMRNVIDFRDHASLFLNQFLEGEVRVGNSFSYGLEFFVKKDVGKLTGWISYTYSKTRRLIPEINKGMEYPATYDTPHDVSAVAMYKLSKRIGLSANWVYSTGAPRTFPTGRLQYQGMVVPVYSDRNSVRIPDYHRLDFSIDYDLKDVRKSGKKKKIESSFNLSIYNVYNRHNAYSITFVQDANNPQVTYAEKLYLFPLLPTFSYNFKF
jgi:hypothetical protein